MRESENHWHLYVLQCKDGTLYCGITTDLARRLEQHNAGTGARYTRARRPVVMAKSWPCEDRSSALKSEAAFKKLSRRAKVQKISAPHQAKAQAQTRRGPRPGSSKKTPGKQSRKA